MIKVTVEDIDNDGELKAVSECYHEDGSTWREILESFMRCQLAGMGFMIPPEEVDELLGYDVDSPDFKGYGGTDPD